MRETGYVTALDGPFAKVRFQRTDACQSCRACGLMASGQQEMELTVRNLLNARPGDTVEVDVAGGDVVRVSLYAYILPLVLLIAGVLLGMYLKDAMAWPLDAGICGAVGGLALAALGFLALHALEPVFRRSVRLVPRMVTVMPIRNSMD